MKYKVTLLVDVQQSGPEYWDRVLPFSAFSYKVYLNETFCQVRP
jgi:hypothetical protein